MYVQMVLVDRIYVWNVEWFKLVNELVCNVALVYSCDLGIMINVYCTIGLKYDMNMYLSWFEIAGWYFT